MLNKCHTSHTQIKNDINEYRKKIKNHVTHNENISKDDIALVRLTYYEQDGRE